MLTELEKRVVASIQADIPVIERPFKKLSQQVGISEELYLKTLKDLSDRGVIRRFGATLRHQKSGFEANAMTAWKVDEDRIDRVGEIMAAFREVSHCYRRNPTESWPYNLYTMIHGLDEASCIASAKKMADKTGVTEYQLLFSRKELKKTSMKYFPDVLDS